MIQIYFQRRIWKWTTKNPFGYSNAITCHLSLDNVCMWYVTHRILIRIHIIISLRLRAGEIEFHNVGCSRFEWKIHENVKLINKNVLFRNHGNAQKVSFKEKWWNELAAFTGTLVMHHLCVRFVRNVSGAMNRLFCYFVLLFSPRLWFLIADLFCVRSSPVYIGRRPRRRRRCVWRWFYYCALDFIVYTLCDSLFLSPCVCAFVFAYLDPSSFAHCITRLKSITRRLSLAKWTNDFCFVNIHEIWIH